MTEPLSVVPMREPGPQELFFRGVVPVPELPTVVIVEALLDKARFEKRAEHGSLTRAVIASLQKAVADWIAVLKDDPEKSELLAELRDFGVFNLGDLITHSDGYDKTVIAARPELDDLPFYLIQEGFNAIEFTTISGTDFTAWNHDDALFTFLE